jgi:uncharacterized cofD-like protein
MRSDSDIPRVVTIGGGHGQAVALRALRMLDCKIAAVVATADDGGCSGELRRELGMPAPGDLRRCLSALALDEELALLLEDRIAGKTGTPRCRGNLVLAQRYLEYGSLQRAVDWVATRLGSVGQVMPASEESGTLVVCDRWKGLVEGENNVAKTVASPLVVTVTGAYRPNRAALAAIDAADIIIMGPGSFCTSTLSALLTGEVGAAVCRSSARRLLVLNLTNKERPCASFREHDFTSALASHLTISSLGDTPEFAALRHAAFDGENRLEDGTVVFSANIAADDGIHHSTQRLALALRRVMGLSARNRHEVPLVQNPSADRNELVQAIAQASDFLQHQCVYQDAAPD